MKGSKKHEEDIAAESASSALACVLDCLPGERIMIISDSSRADVADAFVRGATSLGLWTRHYGFPPRKGVRKDVPADLLEAMNGGAADIYVNLLEGPAAETPFRIGLMELERRRRIRLGHCPGVTFDMLTRGALRLDPEQYKDMQEFAGRLMARLRGALRVHVGSPAGTDLVFSVEEREFFTDTKLDWRTMKWMNLPVGEVLVAPVEDSMEGVLVCGRAVGGVGLIDSKVNIIVEGGRATHVKGAGRGVISTVKKALDTCPNSSTVGEFAFGLNPSARVVPEFLETEKVSSTVHIAFGNNIDFPGGRNSARNHMDLLIDRPTVEVTFADGRTEMLMSSGRHTTR